MFGKESEWQRQNQRDFSAGNAVMNLPNGWGSAGVQGVEYDGGSAVRTDIIRYGSRAVCGSGFADGGTGETGWRAGKASQLR